MKYNIPFKSQLLHITDIPERNKTFGKLSDRDKRMEIAYDALMLIINGIAQPSYKEYWSCDVYNITKYAKTAQELQTILCSIDTCTVCQRGLIMVSTIRLGNNIDPHDNSRSNGSGSNIKGFNYSDMIRMEEDFETGMFITPYHRRTKLKLANCCCNIIYNGNFVSSDFTDYLELWNIDLQ